MRYRVKSYQAHPILTDSVYYIQVSFSIPSSANRENTDAWKAYAKESARLIIDETAGAVFVSSMQKGNIAQVGTPTPATLIFNVSLPTGAEVTSYTTSTSLTYSLNGKSYTITSSDKFTIEMDWGEKPEDTKADVSACAKEATLGTASDSSTAATVFGKIAGVNAAVKDGNDTAISVGKEIRSEVGTGSDTAAESGTLFAILKWVKDKVKSIFNLIGSPASGQPSTLFGAVEDIALSATTLQSLADSWAAMVTEKNRLDEFVFVQGVDAQKPSALLSLNRYIEEIDDDTTVSIETGSFYLNGTNSPFLNLKKARFRKLSLWTPGQNLLTGATALRSLTLDVAINNSSEMCAGCTHLRELYIPAFDGLRQSYYNLLNCVKLYRIVIATQVTNGNITMTIWNPTEALASDSSSLVEPGETFTSNLDKLLYNLREYTAANLKDLTGLQSRNITFIAAVKAAIQADTATAQAFSNKNWTIA